LPRTTSSTFSSSRAAVSATSAKRPPAELP
jgi:hypothetical protein